MKVLVCKNKHCRGKESEELLKALKDKDVILDHSSCMDMCDSGPNLFVIPSLKMYGNVTLNRLDDVLNGNADDLLYKDEIDDLDVIDEYTKNPMHERTVKLFRWHLDKQEKSSVAELCEIISDFKKKYDVNGIDFTNPVKIALIGSHQGPDLPKLIHYLGKERAMQLFDEYLKRNKQ
ncbi:Glutamate--tRNA ligase [Candidatus Izimaplasma bacterium HR1]|jgi:(2Fe-2S) ferredoxin|uniref:(2Fe-2S) ferredoxin domain-containing protein n=1 Tax=Candidatus Izimoplasma sp. HR1 TaxID=1541959 RepID=UPI0004F89D41|nr:Glutamate--tRNA ligase [Candidatus Izimaplasma bacterium HR1]